MRLMRDLLLIRILFLTSLWIIYLLLSLGLLNLDIRCFCDFDVYVCTCTKVRLDMSTFI